MSDVLTGQVVYDPRGVVEAETRPTAKNAAPDLLAQSAEENDVVLTAIGD